MTVKKLRTLMIALILLAAPLADIEAGDAVQALDANPYASTLPSDDETGLWGRLIDLLDSLF